MAVAKSIVLFCLAALLLSGCVHQPVRHLASDASLITPGRSTKTDVLTYLGDPDERQENGSELERWLYYEEQLSCRAANILRGEMVWPQERQSNHRYF